MNKINFCARFILAITIIGFLVIVETSYSQQKTSLQRTETEDFESDYMMTRIYGEENQLCQINLKPKVKIDDTQHWNIVPFDVVEKFIESQISERKREKLKELVTFYAGCTSFGGEYDEWILINKTYTCTNKNGVTSVSINWKSFNCKQK